MLWVIGITVLATSRILILLQNFKTPEKFLERKVEHRYIVFDPQFRREMSVLLGRTLMRLQSRLPPRPIYRPLSRIPLSAGRAVYCARSCSKKFCCQSNRNSD